jgi:hypothetical protein
MIVEVLMAVKRFFLQSMMSKGRSGKLRSMAVKKKGGCAVRCRRESSGMSDACLRLVLNSIAGRKDTNRALLCTTEGLLMVRPDLALCHKDAISKLRRTPSLFLPLDFVGFPITTPDLALCRSPPLDRHRHVDINGSTWKELRRSIFIHNVFDWCRALLGVLETTEDRVVTRAWELDGDRSTRTQSAQKFSVENSADRSDRVFAKGPLVATRHDPRLLDTDVHEPEKD